MKRVSILFFLLMTCHLALGLDRSNYEKPDEIHRYLKALTVTHGDRVTVETIGRSPGRRPVDVVTVTADSKQPGVLVVANMAGDSPFATRAALQFIDHLIQEPGGVTWHILPLGNPDGYQRFFSEPAEFNPLNDQPVNQDMDPATDEDPPEDLNRDGYITLMRQKHPEGEWVICDQTPVLMRKADASKGEAGVFRLFSEGRDNDGDGCFNEDRLGGVNPGWNFPHRFTYYKKENGLWPACAPETRAVLEYALSHPELAMVLVLGRSNTLRDVPQGAKGGMPDKLRLPGRWARRLGVDPGQALPVKDLLPLVRQVMNQPDMSADELIQMVQGEPAMKPDARDLVWWKRAAKMYKDALKEEGDVAKRLPSQDVSSGALEEWAYFQFGVPSFAVDFWTAPVASDSSKKKASKEESLYAFDSTRFIEWTPYQHPQLGEVEIGGPIPWSDCLPPEDSVDVILNRHLPALKSLADLRARVDIARVEVTARAESVWQVDAWIANKGAIPWPTYQGDRCQRPTPAVVTLSGADELLEGRHRTVLKLLKGRGGTQKVRWVIPARKGEKITIHVQGYGAGQIQRTLSLKGGVQ